MSKPNTVIKYIPTARGPACKEINPFEQFKHGWKKSYLGITYKDHYKVIIEDLPKGIPGQKVYQIFLGAFHICEDTLYYLPNLGDMTKEHPIELIRIPADIPKNKKDIWLKSFAQYLIDEPDMLSYHIAISEFTMPKYIGPIEVTA